MFFGKKWEFLTQSQAEPVVKATFGPFLAQAHFEEAGPLKWVRQSSPEIWWLFEFYRTKGAGLRARWGLSLPFVPHVSGREVRWHRTPKSALLDLWLWSPELEAKEPPVFDLCYGLKELTKQCTKRAGRILETALSSLEQAKAVSDLPQLYEQQKVAWKPAMGFYTWSQHPISHAFVLARLGKREEGLEEIGGVVQSEFVHERARARLLSLFEAV